MQFNILEFLRGNKIVLVWVVFGALIWVMRDLFGMVFITFVLSFIICGVTRFCTHVLKLKNRRLVVCAIYLLLVAAIAVFIFKGFPKLMAETSDFYALLPHSRTAVHDLLNQIREMVPPLSPFLDTVTPDLLISRGWSWGRSLVTSGWHYISWFFIGIVFSFLIVFDLPDLMQKFRSLRYTRVNFVYDETVSSVIQLAKVVGENFKAQIYISALNTAFTFVGLTFLGIGTTALLSVIVFACGLIPVMGVFISSVPVMLVAINKGGLHLLGYAVILIVVIHLIEAYVLNPRIVASTLRLNPVITLMILYIAHSAMGLWGMFLGVPISVYIYSQITKRPDNGHSRPAAEAGPGPPGLPDPPGTPASGDAAPPAGESFPEAAPAFPAQDARNGTAEPGSPDRTGDPSVPDPARDPDRRPAGGDPLIP
ncbi:MAG: AI-2E family transporter [Deltaproteobacteria bacterium]|jgi:predicted PurR-regulated permease PerM|nr:AI-2E family transporter [Deltaproteobacteria bacterium]